MRYFATAIPGLGPILARELGALAGVEADPQRQFDGRNDVVAFAAKRPDGLFGLRTSEDVFVEVATASRTGGLHASVRGLCDVRAVERALSVYDGTVRPLRAGMTFRVIARVLVEREFQRRALRDALTRAIQQIRPRWRVADPAALEVWALETRPGRIRMGVRLTTSAMRHRGGRSLERPGTLRPTVAAAMVLLVGPPMAPSTATLLDPCCGSGTILAEAAAAGWASIGADLDPAAVALARGNLGGTGSGRLLVADARRLPLADHSVAALTANLPFGKQYTVPGSAVAWYAATLAEFSRVTPGGVAVALLVPPTTAFRRALAAQPDLTVEGRFDLRLLGMATTLWQLRRRH